MYLKGVEFSEQSERWEEDSEGGMNALREEIEILQNTIHELATCIVEDTDNTTTVLASLHPSLHKSPSKVELSSLNYDEEDHDDHNISLSPTNSFERSKRPPRSGSPSRMARMRSMSPVRARSPAVADSAVSMAQSALKKRQLQVQVSEEAVNVIERSFILYQ